MIQEEYVSLKTAKTLKELGFDIPCREILREEGIRGGSTLFTSMLEKRRDELIDGDYLAPTLDIVVQWLLEEHNLFVLADYDFHTKWWFYKIKDLSKIEEIRGNKSLTRNGAYYDGIDRALEIIKERKDESR